MANRYGTWKVIATVGGFIIVIIGAAVTYGMLTKDVERTHEEVDAVCAEVKVLKPRVAQVELNNAEVNKDIYYMQQDIEEIKENNKAIKKGVDNIIEKLNE